MNASNARRPNGTRRVQRKNATSSTPSPSIGNNRSSTAAPRPRRGLSITPLGAHRALIVRERPLSDECWIEVVATGRSRAQASAT